MSVPLDLPGELERAAKDRAVTESVSLAKWVARLVEKELSQPEPEPETQAKKKSLIEILAVKDAPDWFYEKEFPLEDRRAGTIREFSFEDE